MYRFIGIPFLLAASVFTPMARISNPQRVRERTKKKRIIAVRPITRPT